MRGLAEQMGVTSAALSEWNKGHKPIPDERIRQLAKIAGQDPGPWLLLIHSEQDQGELGREWAKLYKRLGITAAGILCAIGIAANPLIAKAKAAEPKSETRVACILCPKKAGDELFFDPIVFLQLPLERHIRWRSCSGRLIVEVRVAQAAATAELQ
ncbi:Phage related protein [Xanthomonas fragariae]|uniref:Phage related protein n=1 Tax=Xanthomonas fragariae TaxID=48664 RepID=A0ABY1RPW2_9XANT|nr:Phage related protein [Xanthomonas fragariae]